MNDVDKKFHQKGYRLTKQREQIINALTSHPQSVLEVISSLKSKGDAVDKVTVYRTLDRLVELNVVAKTQFKDQTAKYELISQNKHHHHLVCDKCGLIKDIPLDDDFLTKKIKNSTDFQIKSHSLEFFGLCSKCQ